MSKTYSAGKATAYGAAVRGGYTGTYAEWCAAMADFGDKSQQAIVAAEQAAQSATEAANSATDAADSAISAETFKGNAADSAAAAHNSETNAAASESAAAQSATGAAGSASEAATSEASAAASAAAAQAVLDSIPADYTALSNDVDKLEIQAGKNSDIMTANLMGIDVQVNLYPGSADWSGEWINSDTAVIGLSDEEFYGYPVMYSSQSWRRYYKTIPIEAGKTYTFEAWIKPMTVGTVAIYVTDTNTQNPANVSTTSKAYQNTPANAWVKLSLTFNCTASGIITPYVISRSGAFYFAKYMLVEGDSVFSLSNALASKAPEISVSGIGDYHKYIFSHTNALDYWNPSIKMPVPIGTKCKLVFDSFSGNYLSYVRVDGKRADGTYQTTLGIIRNPLHGAETEFITSEAYTEFRFQFYSTTAEASNASIYFTTSAELGIANDLLSMSKQRIIHVDKNGGGDFTSFVDGINEACKYMDSLVYVGAGTYDLLDELGSDYVQNPSSSKKGVELKNRVHVICSSQTVLKMDNTGTVFEYLSPINTGIHGCTLENATIIDNGVRYSVHDDLGGSGATPYTNRFINCTMIHKNGMYGDCIGGGLGENGEIEIRGCYFEGDLNTQRLAYYHGNNNASVTNAKCRLVVADNYFANTGTFKMIKYGQSQDVSTAYVSNNSFGSAPSVDSGSVAPYDNVAMIAWNNEIRP